MLKKQTVWLLTMLSLMVVLSVYYILSPKTNEVAYINDGEEETNDEEVSQDMVENDDIDVEDVSEEDGTDSFTQIRLDLQDKRSMKKSRLNDIVASNSATTEEKNEALETMDTLDERTSSESILEQSILDETDYKDVLVRSNDDKVLVHVQASELSDEEVVNIMQMVNDEYGDVSVVVNTK
ncbi:MAG TPA: SpoIIIAH-like family protein [Virgibacillus sp.]|nr:SpoIIIAH-like family protein [Virgibacillus sp.]